MEFTDWLEYERQGGPIFDDYDMYEARQEWLKEYRPNIFFVGLNPRWQMYKFLPHGINVMYSAFGFWNNTKKEWRRGYKFKKSFGLKWLDCGGFTALNHYDDYPFSVVNYANLVARLKPHFYAAMDYPCEPDISRSLGLMSNKARIEATIRNTLELSEWESQLPGQMVPVIQGYSLDDYIDCLRRHDDAGTLRDYMAVGSMCRRISNSELGHLISGICYEAQRLGVFKLHFFGLKLTEEVQVYDDMIWSRDSAISMASSPPEWRKAHGGRRFPKGQEEKRVVFNYFLEKLGHLNLNYRTDT